MGGGGGMPMSSFTSGLSGLGGLFTPSRRCRDSAAPPGAAKGIPALPGLDRPGLANETRMQKYTRRISRAITAAFPEIAEIRVGYRPDSTAMALLGAGARRA